MLHRYFFFHNKLKEASEVKVGSVNAELKNAVTRKNQGIIWRIACLDE